MSRESSSSPSEGEIIESGSEKANTSTNSIKDVSVDRQSRTRISLSRSPSPYRSASGYRTRGHSRDDSRSPYRESRGPKRPHDDDHYDRSRNDPRRFKVRYEDSRPRERGSARPPYRDLDRQLCRDRKLSYVEDQNSLGRPKYVQRYGRRDRTSPPPRRPAIALEQLKSRDGHLNDRSWREQGGRGFRESRDRLSNEQSVSDRGHDPIATAQSKHKAETNNVQTQDSINDDTSINTDLLAKYVPPPSPWQTTKASCNSGVPTSADIADKAARPAAEAQLDEAALIEERRKRREAIKAKHRGQATPMLVQALALDSKHAPATPKTAVLEDAQPQGE